MIVGFPFGGKTTAYRMLADGMAELEEKVLKNVMTSLTVDLALVYVLYVYIKEWTEVHHIIFFISGLMW